MSQPLVRHENYQHDESYTREGMSRRTASSTARFFTPYLKPGMRVLDCGCGQGSVTIDLAEIVAPGEAIGIDVRETDLADARVRAGDRGVGNVSFQAASAYELPFPDQSFDAAFAHQVLHHLGDPLAALKEMHRVLKPGGIAGMADHAWDRVLRAPINPALEKWDDLRVRIITHIGGTPLFARDQVTALDEAGFTRTDSSFISYGRTEARSEGQARPSGGSNVNVLYLRSVGRPVVLEQGWATEAELDEMEQALIESAEDPQSLFVLPVCWAIGWA
jgi:SAM-dependent methyltransferase